MSKIKFSEGILKIFPPIFDYVQSKSINKIILYILNSNFRKATCLKLWIARFVQEPSQIVLDYADKIPTRNSYDSQMLEILWRVKNNFRYKSDKDVWGFSEYWQKPDETIKLGTGDCEDGMILMYVLARLKGIPANRLFCFCGDVTCNERIGGHAYLCYKPQNYPLNMCIMDWCYYYTGKYMSIRPYFFVKGKIIYNCETNKQDERYKRIWFAFNEVSSYSELNTEWNLVGEK